MANPQPEDGYVRIANEIAEALSRTNLSPYESRILWCVLRKTYGFNKKTARITHREFSEATGIDRRIIHRTVSSLAERSIIAISRDGKKSITYGIQKNYEKWKTLPSVEMAKKFAICGDGSLPSVEMAILPSVEMAKPIYTLWKDKKDNLKTCALPGSADPGAGADRAAARIYLTRRKRRLTGQVLDRFEEYLEAYGQRKGKAAAADAWLDIPGYSDDLAALIVEAAKAEASSPERRRHVDRGGTIKYPQGWITERRWEDYEERKKAAKAVKKSGNGSAPADDEAERMRLREEDERYRKAEKYFEQLPKTEQQRLMDQAGEAKGIRGLGDIALKALACTRIAEVLFGTGARACG